MRNVQNVAKLGGCAVHEGFSNMLSIMAKGLVARRKIIKIVAYPIQTQKKRDPRVLCIESITLNPKRST